MYVLSGFGDEISDDLREQLDTMAAEGLRWLELRGVWGKNVMALDDTEVAAVKAVLKEKNFRISAIGSPIGKVKITDDFKPHFESFKRAVYLAKYLEAKFVRVFSYYPPEGGNIKDYRKQVMERMKAKADYAEKEGVMLALENEHGIYGEDPESCLDILQTVNSPNLKLCFDPANFIIDEIKPFDRAYPLLKDWIVYFHIKDGIPRSKTPEGATVCVPAGEGEGQIKEVLSAYSRVCGFKEVILTLEPHLAKAGQFAGFTGPNLFKTAVRALKKILAQI